MYFLLLGAWLLLNGRVTAELIVIGALLCAGLYGAACRLLGYSPRRELALLRRVPGALCYGGLLVWNILLSNLQVMGVVLSPKAREIRPRLVYFPSPVDTAPGRVTLANSITLTPGTITAGLTEDGFCVHALDEAFAAGLEDSSFVRAIRRMEGAAHD